MTLSADFISSSIEFVHVVEHGTLVEFLSISLATGVFLDLPIVLFIGFVRTLIFQAFFKWSIWVVQGVGLF